MSAFDPTVPVVGILRGFTTPQVLQIVRAAIWGGLKNLEITLNSPGALEQIREASAEAAGELSIGAGTVLSLEGLEQAIHAGATFIVTPTTNAAVIQECVRSKIPVFPGAMTPTEIFSAWELGATMVKIFPSETLGPNYIRAVKAPFPKIKLMPTGGVDLASVAEYKKAGAEAFGVGSPLFDRARVEAGDWAWVEMQCRAFVDLVV
jgi:2-dehydro-3-deoxyphosphogluconate aldolase/(4S)-4-hydroxy-2-oxoglutarate aldolase